MFIIQKLFWRLETFETSSEFKGPSEIFKHCHRWCFLWCHYDLTSGTQQGGILTLFRMGFFGAAHGWGGGKKAPLPKICLTYPTMMKLSTVIRYPKKIQKMYESRDTPLEFCWHQHFVTVNHQMPLYQGIHI